MVASRVAVLFVALLGCKGGAGRGPSVQSDDLDPAAPSPRGRAAVILMIGDGMGVAQLAAAGMYAHGEPGTLFLESLPIQGAIETDSVDGVTDSAAAATAMACGVRCANYRIGEDYDGDIAINLVEISHVHGWKSGIVTTTAVTHATPAAFTVHQRSRFDMVDIATEQVTLSRPHVILGGGLAYFLPAGESSARSDDGLIDDLHDGGYQIVYTSEQLAQVGAPDRLFGAFAPDHLDFVRERAPDTTQPGMVDMTRTALDVLDRDGASFFLLVEGGRIDHGGHNNSIHDTVFETLAFDDAVRTVAQWADGRDYVTIIVNADHETGGLDILENRGKGQMPAVSWTGSEHTGADVRLFGRGPGLEQLDDRRRRHTWVFAAARALITGTPFTAPEP